MFKKCFSEQPMCSERVLMMFWWNWLPFEHIMNTSWTCSEHVLNTSYVLHFLQCRWKQLCRLSKKKKSLNESFCADKCTKIPSAEQGGKERYIKSNRPMFKNSFLIIPVWLVLIPYPVIKFAICMQLLDFGMNYLLI